MRLYGLLSRAAQYDEPIAGAPLEMISASWAAVPACSGQVFMREFSMTARTGSSEVRLVLEQPKRTLRKTLTTQGYNKSWSVSLQGLQEVKINFERFY